MNTKDLKISNKEVAEIILKNTYEGLSSTALGDIYGLNDSYVRKIIRQERRTDVEMTTVKGFKNYVVTSEGQIYSIATKRFVATDPSEKVRLYATKKGQKVKKTFDVQEIVNKHFS